VDQTVIDDSKFMEEEGVAFNEVDLAVWGQAVEPVYAKFSANWSPGLLDTIKGLTG
jgi:hypothetical protein